MNSYKFHRIVERWFKDKFPSPTDIQAASWPVIAQGHNTLVAAPTGSGKTLTAFLVGIDQLLRQSLEGELEDSIQIVYVSPLKALSHDVEKNLKAPISELMTCAKNEGQPHTKLRVEVRTGDTPSNKRQAINRKPPHILVTTPESLFLMLTSKKARENLRTVKTVVVDEIHALARDKRGSHLSLTLERLAHLSSFPIQRIGLSATQKPIEDIGNFLVGSRREVKYVNLGHQRELDLNIELPRSELSAVCSHEQWDEVYFRLKQLIDEHRSCLIFVNTRKMAERVAYFLSQYFDEGQITSHHGSLSKDKRLQAEEKLKNGELKAIVATASLELGIDIGYIDLVCQIGSPRSIATFLQRIGRSGHSIGAVPKGRLFALTRDELLEAIALIQCVKNGSLDSLEIPHAPLDILSQQIIAACSLEDWQQDELYNTLTRAKPYESLSKSDFDDLIKVVAMGYAKGRQKFSYLHHDRMSRTLKGTKSGHLAALMSGGAIPEQGDFRVVTEGDRTFVGTVNEDFAIESARGDIFLLGNTSWQIAAVRSGEVIVRDAGGAPPSIPFWLGEAPGRTFELSKAFSDIRRDLAEQIQLPSNADDPLYRVDSLEVFRDRPHPTYNPATEWLRTFIDIDDWAAIQACHYVAVQKAAMGLIPTQEEIVYERFFDPTGGMQLVIHAPFGMRINRGFGLALRKRFCRSFDFELQASADDNGVVLSLGPQHSFPIEQLFHYLTPENVQGLLEQAILQVPLFQIRWRWNATRALAVLRMQSGKRVPPALQRFRSDDLMTAIFPAQTQCKEHVTGDIELPNHPFVHQTMHDCLTEAIDIHRLHTVVSRIKEKEIHLIPKDMREPSPFSYQLLNANPYAFLDDAPLEERRARAVATRRGLALDVLSDLASLDQAAIDHVRAQAWPLVRSSDELLDTLKACGIVALRLAKEWLELFDQLVEDGRACQAVIGSEPFMMACEMRPLVEAAYTKVRFEPEFTLPEHIDDTWSKEDALSQIIQQQLEISPVICLEDLASRLALAPSRLNTYLIALEGRGIAMRGKFCEDGELKWCARQHLIRIHKLTLEGLRAQIRPVGIATYMDFLFEYHGLGHKRSEEAGLAVIIKQLQGFSAPLSIWEGEILPTRMENYQSQTLDQLCFQGQSLWGRIDRKERSESSDSPTAPRNLAKNLPISIMERDAAPWLTAPKEQDPQLSGELEVVYVCLKDSGSQFVNDIAKKTGLLPTQVENYLGQLATLGLASCDGLQQIRPSLKATTRRRGSLAWMAAAAPRGGRWGLFPPVACDVPESERLTNWAWQLLYRYGVVFRDLLAREKSAPKWQEIAKTYRLMEARGEIRGGRFVDGVSGEQFALGEVIPMLRQRPQLSGDYVVISASDPLNLWGIITDEAKIKANPNSKLIYRFGRLVAVREKKQLTYVEPMNKEEQSRIERLATLNAQSRELILQSSN